MVLWPSICAGGDFRRRALCMSCPTNARHGPVRSADFWDRLSPVLPIERPPKTVVDRGRPRSLRLNHRTPTSKFATKISLIPSSYLATTSNDPITQLLSLTHPLQHVQLAHNGVLDYKRQCTERRHRFRSFVPTSYLHRCYGSTPRGIDIH